MGLIFVKSFRDILHRTTRTRLQVQTFSQTEAVHSLKPLHMQQTKASSATGLLWLQAVCEGFRIWDCLPRFWEVNRVLVVQNFDGSAF